MNANDRYAVAVVKNEITIGHLSRKVSKILYVAMEESCTVTGG